MMKTPEVDRAAIERAVAVLEAGGLVAMPTETVYGLAANADDEEAVTNTYRAKGRPMNHPLIVHVAGADDIAWWAELTPEAELLARRFWPGPLTLVLRKKDRCGLWVTGGQDTVALRCPSHPWAHELLAAFGGSKHRGLTAPSANSFGRISPSTAQHVRDDLGEKPEGKLDLILDGGPCEFGIESTMVNLSSGRPEILRHGIVTRAMLEEVLGCPVPDAGADAPRASGRLKSHYAPKTKAELVKDADIPARALSLSGEGLSVAVFAPEAVREALEAAGVNPHCFIKAPADALSYGAFLYEALHELDASGAGRILIAEPPSDPEWAAVDDRLGRATA
ncbi:L-threonylcarbamoyladenylate synthase [Sutterella sp.]|uniref:L-threonylcarbamoyladenylate synthase n=1 Tax=Sutterella sp. TaxID=1981025 RepID=UPI0026DFBBD8|nr:L-threonylcarbamoyladenylate synthase [Sutterella sp.]MDO5530600.1 L-threonylcarbamoyladenylate synthase [Sutterella sp.]